MKIDFFNIRVLINILKTEASLFKEASYLNDSG
jgi:hypothetical protein